MASFAYYREISYIVDLLSWNTIVGKIYYRDSPSRNLHLRTEMVIHYLPCNLLALGPE